MEVNAKNLNIQSGPAEEPSSLTGDAIQKEMEALAREAAAKAMVEAARIEANKALMKILDETPIRDNRSQKAETQDSTDSTELSNESLAYNRKTEEEVSRQRQLERLLSDLWKLFEEWQPRLELGLEQEILQLNAAYQKLLQEILQLYPQSQAGIQTDRINSLLLEIIQKMNKERFPALLELLTQYGKKGAEDLLIASVLEKIIGRTVPPQEIGAAKARKELEHRQENNPSLKKEGNGTRRFGTERGILYHREKGNQIGANQRYKEKVQAQEQLHFRGTGKANPESGRLSFGGKAYSLGDIERAEQFLRYMNGEGNLYNHPDITSVNEEMLGFLMALNGAKVQIFTEYSGIGKEMASDVRDTLDRFFRYYLEQSVRTQAALEGMDAKKALDSRSIQQMYYRVMELIQCMKTPEKGIWKGLQYAWEVFCEKKENEEFSKFKRYEKNAGFFLSSMGNKDQRKELLYGANILDRDWRGFLAAIGQDNNTLLQMTLTNCPWGMLAEPEGGDETGGDKRVPGWMLLMGTVLCIILALVRLMFRG